MNAPSPEARGANSRLRSPDGSPTTFRQDDPSSLLEYFDTSESQAEWARFLKTIEILQGLAKGTHCKVVIDLYEDDAAPEIKDAVTFALNAPYPNPSEVDQHVYA